ncbi:MAG: UDP-N-acetylmuramate dehydrogenase [Burkholderiales bacterium]|nr:UDP-N-acetylmuramate dehydrogenase [Burkholderiales bacterium]
MSTAGPPQGARPLQGGAEAHAVRKAGGGHTSEPLHSSGLRGRLAHDAPLAKYTSWRTGGAADTLYLPADRDDLAAFVRQLPPAEPLTVLGLGSNTLLRDGGVRGAVIVMHNPGAALAVTDGLVYADAGAACPKLARFAATHDCAEAEFLAGIPGTVGGALAMNAGCYGGETWRYVARVEVLTRAGEFEVRTPADYEVGYRHVAPLEGIFTAGWFRFPRGDGAAARRRIKALLERRLATQPLSLPNAGSVFRNPPGDHAARLIEACGLKGFAIGGARVSEKHANFIVNPRGQAKAADIEALIAHVRETVRAKTGVELVPEVRIVGEP